ncbi:MAG: tetratricopeptide repeat protein [Magnetovibrio sp.]|nr:tetratricopeptide repeat protein [Magnetovibrio sp.]
MAKAAETKKSGGAAKAAAKAPAKKAAAKKKATAKKAPAKKATARKTPAKRTAKMEIKPEPQPAPVGPTPEQIATWRALSQEQRSALREREAARVFAEAAEAHQKGDLAAAVKGYNKSLLLNPKVPDVYNNLGVALRATGKLEAAVACYRRSLSLRPASASVFSNMGNALREMGRLQTAVACHQQAVKLAPNNAESFYNMGLALRDLGQVDQALACFNKTLSIKPEHVDCHWDRSLTLLTKGDFERGFEEYEWRWKLDRSPPRGFDQPEWDGSEIKGKTLLIHQEQGFGDLIHFARYLPMVKKASKAATVIVEVQPELARLFSTLDGVDKVVDKGATLPKFDFYLPIMSLARVFGTVVATIPADIPYLDAPEMETVKLPPSMENQLKIGIAWAGRRTRTTPTGRASSPSSSNCWGCPASPSTACRRGRARPTSASTAARR